jgi:hypothetical protein
VKGEGCRVDTCSITRDNIFSSSGLAPTTKSSLRPAAAWMVGSVLQRSGRVEYIRLALIQNLDGWVRAAEIRQG